MATKPKYSELHDDRWWKQNKDKTNVELANELNCAVSTVQFARYKMKIKPLSQRETSRRQWASIDFRKKIAHYPQLYKQVFWKQNKDKTNNEIAKKLGCSTGAVKIAREILGYASLSSSEAQKRRYLRDGILEKRVEISPQTRKKVMERANYTCEVPGCDVNEGLEIHHLKRNSKDLTHLLCLCYSHHVWMEKTHKIVKNYDEAITLLKKVFPL